MDPKMSSTISENILNELFEYPKNLENLEHNWVSNSKETLNASIHILRKDGVTDSMVLVWC